MTPDAYAPPATHGSLMLIHRLDRIARRRSEIALAPLGLRKRQVVALMILREHGAIAQSALGETLRLDPANLVGLLNELEDQGLLDRRRDSEDRRRHIVELTPAGIAALGRAQDALAGVQDHVLAGLDDDERCALHELLVKAAQQHLATDGFAPAAEPEACAEE